MAEKLSECEIAEFRDIFGLFDKDKDEHIRLPELKAIMKQMNNDPTDDELKCMIHEIDADGDGAINFPEFLEMMSKNLPKSKQRINDSLREAFDLFDKDHDGYITVEEMKCVLHENGEEMTDKDVQEMINEADMDGDGKVNYTEFLSIMSKDTIRRDSF